MLYFLAPVLMITFIGAGHDPNQNGRLYGLMSGLTIIIYCLFEETGWRGFLQDAMRDVPNPYRFIIIGIFWYLWHLNFISAHDASSLRFGLLVHLPSCILGSWIIGSMADKYKSLMVAAAIHSIFNIFFDLDTDLKAKIIIVTGIFMIWIPLSWMIEKTMKIKI